MWEINSIRKSELINKYYNEQNEEYIGDLNFCTQLDFYYLFLLFSA